MHGRAEVLVVAAVPGAAEVRPVAETLVAAAGPALDDQDDRRSEAAALDVVHKPISGGQTCPGNRLRQEMWPLSKGIRLVSGARNT